MRSIPRSRTNPQYNFDVIADELEPWQLGYRRIAELGGRRSRSKTVPPGVNAYWENQSFHNYADYALSDQFGAALSGLMELSSSRRCAIMCAESVWWRCHRRIIADYLLASGRDIFHLMGTERVEPAKLTPAARLLDGKIVYPASA